MRDKFVELAAYAVIVIMIAVMLVAATVGCVAFVRWAL